MRSDLVLQTGSENNKFEVSILGTAGWDLGGVDAAVGRRWSRRRRSPWGGRRRAERRPSRATRVNGVRGHRARVRPGPAIHRYRATRSRSRRTYPSCSRSTGSSFPEGASPRATTSAVGSGWSTSGSGWHRSAALPGRHSARGMTAARGRGRLLVGVSGERRAAVSVDHDAARDDKLVDGGGRSRCRPRHRPAPRPSRYAHASGG